MAEKGACRGSFGTRAATLAGVAALSDSAMGRPRVSAISAKVLALLIATLARESALTSLSTCSDSELAVKC